MAGLIRPVVVLPADFAATLTRGEVRMALAHELAHVRRGDLWLAIVPACARILCFFCPPLWQIPGRHGASAREAACDQIALAATGASRARYGRLLLKIVAADNEGGRFAAASLGATASFHTLRERLRFLKHPGAASAPPPRRIVALALVALPLLVPWRLVAPRGASAAWEAFPLDRGVPVAGPLDVATVPALALRAENDPDKRYLLIGGARAAATPPRGGYRLLVVLPSGAGGADFSPFVRRIARHALGDGYLVAQPIATWDEKQKNEIVWPTRTNPWPGMKFSTEAFVEAVIRDVGRRYPVDARHVFVLGWASGGPPAYALALAEQTPVKGALVAFSIFGPDWLPPLENARHRPFFLLHPTDAPLVPFALAQRAARALRENGGAVELVGYQGGYGWSGDVYAQIRRGVRFLEAASKEEL